MTQCARARTLALALASTLLASVAAGQSAPRPDPPEEEVPTSPPTPAPDASAEATRPSLVKPFVDVLGDLRNLPSWQNVSWLAVGLGAAAAAQPADTTVTRELSEARTRAFRPGTILGGTPLQLSGAFVTYAIGRATGRPRVTMIGGDLIRAQILAELVTRGVKPSVQRTRPDGERFSFPSGHTAVTFASATVLQQHLGWKVGVPAYAVASYVAVSRVQTKRHYLSDVAFGAAIGIVSGRTVTLGRQHKVVLTPVAMPGGGAVSVGWAGW